MLAGAVAVLLVLFEAAVGQLELSVKNEFVAGSNNAIYDYKPSAELRKALPMHLMGFDREGRAVFLIELGKWNFPKILRDYQGRLDLVFKIFEQGVQFFTDMSLEQWRAPNGTLYGPSGSATIIDFKGSTNDFLAPGAVKFYTELLTYAHRTDKYISYAIFINVSSRDQILHRYVLRPLNPLFERRLSVFGPEPAKYIPEILKKISRDQLPPHMGGYANFTLFAPDGQHFNYNL